MLDGKKYRWFQKEQRLGAEFQSILNSGKIEVLRYESLKDEEYGENEAYLKKLRFFGKKPDQYINVIVSQVNAETTRRGDDVFYEHRIEVDPTSPAIEQFESLRGYGRDEEEEDDEEEDTEFHRRKGRFPSLVVYRSGSQCTYVMNKYLLQQILIRLKNPMRTKKDMDESGLSTPSLKNS
jgi:hypothetical protein